MLGSSIVIVGAGGHARVVAEALALSDTAGSQPLAGHIALQADMSGRLGRFLGDDSQLPYLARSCRFVIGIGFVDAAGAQRRRILLERLAELSASLVTVIHPQAMVSPSAELAAGVFVAMGAVVGTGARVGRSAIINSAAVVDHDCVIAPNVHIATGARLAGGVSVGEDVLVGAGSVLIQGLRIGACAVIGAGTVAIRAVGPCEVMVGNPQRPIRQPPR